MYVVDWLRTALDELTVLWLQADAAARQSITAASHEIDQRLAKDPLAEGESREEPTRIMFASQLTVRYQLEPDGKTVTVLHVHIRSDPRR
jgi:hypothetical protein